MHLITEVPNLRGKYVLVRSSCNVPLVDGKVGNRYRLEQALHTLRFLAEQGARTIVLAHIGREESDTLRPVFDVWKETLSMVWGGSVTTAEFVEARASLKDGEILLAENLRQDPRESDNDPDFARLVASFGDIYVNDAFDNIHRDHASMVGVAGLLPAYAGITLGNEVANITMAMIPTAPSLLILGGAKFETKMPLVEKYLALYDHVFVTGALLNDVLKAEGYEVGTSLVSDISLAGAAFLQDPKLVHAVDVVVTGPNGVRTVACSGIAPDEKVIDMGEETVAALAPLIASAKTILWNGPLGLYENGAPGSTHAVAKLVAQSEAFSVLGGGDTVAAVEELGLNDQFGFVSTGGGAMLTLLEAGTTPSLQALG